MKYFLIILLFIVYPQEKPDSTKAKLKKILVEQKKQTAFDSLLIKIAKEDSLRKKQDVKRHKKHKK